MPIESVSALVAALKQSKLLDPPRMEEFARLHGGYTDVRVLIREMVQRDWLTAFQANQVYQGKANDLVLGPYILMAKIGEGFLGQDYKARHRLMNRLVALKVIRAELLAREEAVQRFYHETQSISQLSDPHIVHAYDAGPIGQTHFFAMEFVEGFDLEQLVAQSGPLPIAAAVEFIRQTAVGLQHAHERGMAHHDLKPSNLMVSRVIGQGDGSTSWRSLVASAPGGGALVKICNLGLTFLQTQSGSDSAPGSPAAGGVKGNPDYLAPERAQQSGKSGSKPDIRSDLYSLGCIFYFLLSGRVPFSGGSPVEKVRRHQTEEPVPLNLLRKDAPAGIVAVIGTLMAKKPQSRYQTPAELVHVLAPAKPGGPQGK